MIRALIITILCATISLSCAAQKNTIQSTRTAEALKSITDKPKNVILFVVDGMGLTQLSSLNFYDDRANAFEAFVNIGLQKNTSTSAKVTDSAAAATTFATGLKTYNGAIGMDENKKPIKTIAERAVERGMGTAIIATSSITHATPASFYAHQEYRKMEEEIAQDLWSSNINYFAGGGLKFFKDRSDGLSGLDSLITNGYDVISTGMEMVSRKPKKKIYLMAEVGMPTMAENRGDFLLEKTLEGLNFIDNNEKGFFMMVEGSQVDWGGHNEDHEYIIAEMKDVNTVLTALVEYVKDDGETLLIVTADHETGGFALSAKLEGVRHDTRYLEPTFSTSYHTATMIPVFAMGPGSEAFRGVYENTEIHNRMSTLLLGESFND